MYVKRDLEKTLRKYLKNKEILAVVGPRQSGKTTLLKQIYKGLNNAIFLDFEDRELLRLFEEDIKSFVDLYVKKYKYVFIDEFQYAKEGGKNLKYIYDNYKTKVIISGSSVIGLSAHSLKYLVGRVFVFNLYPFSFEEFLRYKNPELYNIYSKEKPSEPVTDKIKTIFYEFCIYGGYPKVVLTSDTEEKKIVLRNIYNMYFLKEIKEVLGLASDYKLAVLIKALALQVGNIINYNELSSLTGFKHNDLLSHLNILEKTFICKLARPFYTNKRTELVKSPKIFFLDNGFRNTIIKDFRKPNDRQDKGALFENFAASELAKLDLEIKYWRTKSKAEVDFIVEKPDGLVPVEIKSDTKIASFTKSFLSFKEKYKPKVSIIFSESLFDEKNKTIFRPLFLIRKELE